MRYLNLCMKQSNSVMLILLRVMYFVVFLIFSVNPSFKVMKTTARMWLTNLKITVLICHITLAIAVISQLVLTTCAAWNVVDCIYYKYILYSPSCHESCSWGVMNEEYPKFYWYCHYCIEEYREKYRAFSKQLMYLI